MKKEASGKKGKWLWLVLGLVVLLAVVGVVLALVLGGGNDKTVGGRPNLYWNVDKADNVDRNTGLSIREPAEDGNYYVRFAHDGEQVEIPVADKKLVNYIDSLDLMGLTLDDDGFVVDVFQIKDIANVVGESLYVQTVNGDTITANSSIMMNGRKITIKLNADAGVYNVSGKGEFVGEKIDASTLNPMDTISVYGTLVPEDSEEESVVTHVFVLKKPAESKIYFRADQFYDSSKKVTTREPDENGAYTIKWYCEGETVDLKCKDKEMVSTIDSSNYHWCHWGLEFDEDGYIIDILDSFLASRTLMQCERYDITEVSDDGSYTATSLIKNNGAFVQGTVGSDCAIYDISSAAKAEGQVNRKVDSLQLGDRVCIWTDTMGKPVQIYITARRVDSPSYWVVTRSYDSATKQTTRKPNDNGYYEIELLKAGDTKNTTYYTKDIDIATAVDLPSDRVVGLKVGEGNMIEAVYDIESLFGNTYFVRGYFILDATATVCTYLSPAGSGYTKNGVLAADAKVWNISTIGKYGEETTLQAGDYVYAGKTPTGEVAYAYVMRRILKNGENMFYWRIDERKYDTKNKVTTRVPDKDGYYVYLFAHEGKQVTLKTKNKDFATALDSQSSAPAFALEVKGDIITAVHEGTYAYGGSRYNGWTIDAINGNEIDVTSSSGTKDTWDISDAKIFNVSNSYTSHKGERIYSVKVGDVVANYRDINCTPKVIIVKTRETNKMAWPVAPDLNRQPAEDGWFYIKLMVDGKVQEFKCKSESVIRSIDEYTGPFGVQISGNEILYMSTTTYVENVKGSGVTTLTVDSVSGSSVKVLHTLGAADKIGTKETITLSSNAKIYDVTPEAEAAGKLGAVSKLKKGDVIRTYRDNDDNHLYVYIIARHTKDVYSYCSHCDKPVYWTPYAPSSNVTNYDSHYYLAGDLPNMVSQMRVYSTSRDYEIVLDLNGHTARRVGGRAVLVRYGDTLTIIDSVGGGKITTKNNTSGGGVVMLSGDKTDGKGVVNLYAGTLTVDESDSNELYTTQGGIFTISGGELNMYGGEILNGVAYGRTSEGAVGGNIRISSGFFNMYDGKISGGRAFGGTYEKQKKDADNNLMFDESGAPVMETLSATGNGGNIYAYGSSTVVNIYGGTIENGQAARGGNCSFADGTYNIYGGTISGGIADATIYGKSSDGRGGNIFSTGNLTVTGGTVTGGKVTSGYNAGGNIMSTGFNKTVYIADKAVVSNGSATDGNNVYLMYSNLVVAGGTIANGDVTSGGSIGSGGTESGGYSSITVSGGVIDGLIKLGGSVSTKEAPKYPDYRTALTITGGTIESINATKVYNEIVNVSGKPVVKNLTIGGNLLNVGAMESGADLTVDAIGIFTNDNIANAESYTGYFHPVAEGFLTGVTAAKELKFYHPDSVAAYCEHCAGEADWMPWDGASAANGHYYMTENVQLTEAVTVGAGLDMVLDLKGYTITAAENSRVFYLNGGLNVFDSSEGETGVITGGRATRGGNIYVTETGAFALWGGTVTGGVADNAMGTSTTNGRGGNIFTNGIVVLVGGTVSNGTTIGGSSYGGNIMSTGLEAGVMIGGDAVVSGGTAEGGNNIYLMYSNVAVYGGSVLTDANATVSNIGTNSTANGGPCTIEIAGGEVNGIIALGGGTSSDPASKYADYRTALTITGGVVDQVNASKAYENTVLIAGAPVVNKLTLGADVLASVGEMETGASVTVAGTGVFTTAFETKEAAEAAAGYFHALNATEQIVVNDENALSIGSRVYEELTKTIYCEDCKSDVVFTSWYGTAITESGHYFLPEDVYLTSSVIIDSGKTVVIDLNGHKITADSCRAFYVTGATLVIQDAAGNGEIVGGNSGGARGGNIYATSGNLHLYGGWIHGGTATADANNAGHDVAVYNGQFYMNGTAKLGQAYDSGYAAYIFSATDLKLNAGTVTGSLLLRSNAAVKLGDGMVVDALILRDSKLTEVGALNLSEQITVKITNGNGDFLKAEFTDVLANAEAVKEYFKPALNGYKIVVTENKLAIEADTPAGGEDPVPSEQCPHCSQVVTWTPWDGVTATSGHYVLESNITLTGPVKIASGVDMVLDLNGFTVTAAEGKRAFRADGTFSILDSSDAKTGTITGGNVRDTTSTSTYETRGGNVFVPVGTFNMYGGNITNGVAQNRGGNIYATGGATVNIYGGTISGGEAASHANNIFINGSTLNITGGTITDTSDNGVYNVAGYGYTSGNTDYWAYFNINGGTFTGTAKTFDISGAMTEVVISNATVNGAAVINGVAKLEISGKPVLEKLSLPEGTLITAVGTMQDGASVLINATEGVFTAALTNANDVVSYFDAVETGYKAAVNDGKLEIVADTTSGGGDEPAGTNFNCEHCDDENVEWIAWDANTLSASNELAAGHYYLTENVTITGSNIAAMANNDVVIELNGYTISAPADTRAFYVYGTLSIQDSSAEKTGAVIGGTVTDGNGGTFFVTTNATLNLYSGTIKGGSAQRGGNIYIGASSASFNMYGGTVTGGVADQSLTTGSSTTNGRGGNIFGNGATVNLQGGIVSDGESRLNSSGTGSSWGGNVLMNGGTLTIAGDAVIENGVAKSGANLYVVAATMNVSGGTIVDGVATDGRTVCVTGTAAAGASTINVSGGTFDGGVVTFEGAVQEATAGKEYVDYRSVINITGGVLDCQVLVNKANSDVINVSGAAKISDIKLAEGILMNVGTFTDGAKVLINAEPGAVFTAAFADATAAEAALPYVDTVAVDQKVAVSADNKLEIIAACACGCKATNVVWEDANAYMAALAEAGTSKITQNVHLKLSADLSITEIYGSGKQIQIGNSSSAVNVSIDLNGYTWSTNENRAIYVNPNNKLTLIDSSETQTGMLACIGDPGFSTGGVLLVYGDCDLRGGTLTMLNPGTTTTNAGVLYLNTPGTVNMYGGKLVGGVVRSSDSRNAYGGNVYVYQGTFNMYGGMIANGTAIGTSAKVSYGGNLCTRDHSSVHVNLYGGLITGGSADEGDDIYDAGNKVTIGSDMVICSSVTEYFEKYLTFVDNAGYVLDSMTFKLGADFSVADFFENATQIHIGNDDVPVEVTIDLNGYTWTGNHRLYVHAGSTLNIKDSSIEQTGVLQSTGYGSNSGRIMTSYGTVNIHGGTLKMVESENVKPTGAGLIYISKGTLNIYGGVIDGGKVAATASKDAFGGNIYVYSGVFNMYGGTIKNGTATASAEKTSFGGNICIRSLRSGVTSELNLYGGSIEGGEAVNGSSIYVDTGVTYTKNDATIEDEATSVVVVS